MIGELATQDNCFELYADWADRQGSTTHLLAFEVALAMSEREASYMAGVGSLIGAITLLILSSITATPILLWLAGAHGIVSTFSSIRFVQQDRRARQAVNELLKHGKQKNVRKNDEVRRPENPS